MTFDSGFARKKFSLLLLKASSLSQGRATSPNKRREATISQYSLALLWNSQNSSSTLPTILALKNREYFQARPAAESRSSGELLPASSAGCSLRPLKFPRFSHPLSEREKMHSSVCFCRRHRLVVRCYCRVPLLRCFLL